MVLRQQPLITSLILLSAVFYSTAIAAVDSRPNVLFFFVDDWGRDAGVYADANRPSLSDVIATPNIDRIAREGVVFNNAFVPVSSCGPCRASLTTGRYFWNCGSGAFLNGRASDWKNNPNPFKSMTKFPDLLRESGYYSTKSLKTIDFKESNNPNAGLEVPQVEYQRYGLYVSQARDDADRVKRVEATLSHPRLEMRRVLKSHRDDRPFFFIYGTINVHRPWHPDSGQDLWGIDPDELKGRIPKFLPDLEDVRRDFADYLGEVQAADAMLGVILEELETAGQLDNTIVILSGDNGIPGIPRGKTNCYDLSVRAPLMVRWPARIKPGRRIDDFVSTMDIGPTLLEAAGLAVPTEMDGRSFLTQLTSDQDGWIDQQRDHVVVGRELHFHSARDGNLPYPMRAIRTRDYLYIRNFKPDRWPNGAPYNIEDADAAGNYDRLEVGPYRDLDASLTKSWLILNRQSPPAREAIDRTLGLRPAEELYAIQDDPDSLQNLADHPTHSAVKAKLSQQLMEVLRRTNDPRLTDDFDRPPYVVNKHGE
ncbi:MAG: sulfatase [Planctomycetales bacterium]|nr:sulfatase [Planctomycetales bacterium]